MKKSLTLIIALLFSAAIFAQKTSTVQIATKVYEGTFTALKNDGAACYAIIQATSVNGNNTPSIDKLKLVFEADGKTLKINDAAKDLLNMTAAGRKLNDKYLKLKVKVTCTMIGKEYVVTSVVQ